MTVLDKMEIKWKRPNSVPYPSKWRHFEGRKQIDGKIPKFWVQDIPEEMFEEAVEFMCASYIYDEPLCRHIGKKIFQLIFYYLINLRVIV